MSDVENRLMALSMEISSLAGRLASIEMRADLSQVNQRQIADHNGANGGQRENGATEDQIASLRAIEEPERDKSFIFRQTGLTTGTIDVGVFYIDGIPYFTTAEAITSSSTMYYWMLLVNLTDPLFPVGTYAYYADITFSDWTTTLPGWVSVPILTLDVDPANNNIKKWKQWTSSSFQLFTPNTASETKVSFAHKSHSELTVTLYDGILYNAGIPLTITDPDSIGSGSWVFNLASISPASHKITIYIEINLAGPGAYWRACAAGSVPSGTYDTEMWPIITVTLDDADANIIDWKNEWVSDIHITRSA